MIHYATGCHHLKSDCYYKDMFFTLSVMYFELQQSVQEHCRAIGMVSDHVIC